MWLPGSRDQAVLPLPCLLPLQLPGAWHPIFSLGQNLCPFFYVLDLMFFCR